MNASTSGVILIDAHAGFSAAYDLLSSLHNMRQEPVVIDASAVEHIGAPYLEVLLSAAKSWKNDAIEFRVINPTVAFSTGISRLGILPSQLGENSDKNAD